MEVKGDFEGKSGEIELIGKWVIPMRAMLRVRREMLNVWSSEHLDVKLNDQSAGLRRDARGKPVVARQEKPCLIGAVQSRRF